MKAESGNRPRPFEPDTVHAVVGKPVEHVTPAFAGFFAPEA